MTAPELDEEGVAPGDGQDHAPDGLFGVSIAPGTVRWNPEPAVTINGEVIPGGPPPGGNLDGLVGIDRVSVSWGTDEPLDPAPPATASISLLDFTRRYATDRDLIGLPVVLSWTTSQAQRVFFRGRITDLELTRVNIGRPDGSTVPAARLDLTCASIEVDLANRFPTEKTWPSESVGARADRLAAYCYGVADRVVINPGWAPGTCAPVTDANKTSIRDHLVALFNSSNATRITYSPDRMAYEWQFRSSSAARSLQRLWTGSPTHPRANLGAWIGPDNLAGYETGATQTPPPTPLFLDADWLEYPDGLTRSAASRITRVTVTSKDPADQVTDVRVTRVDPDANEAVIGQRAATFTDIYASTSYTDALADDLLSIATQEGAAWRPQRIRWDTRRTGGFPHHGLAATLLIGHLTGHPWSINGSWVAAYSVRPLFRITGGVITYVGGPNRGWVLDLDVAGYASTVADPQNAGRWLPVKQHAITFEEIDDGTEANTVRWWDDDRPDGLHESVTFEDLGHVGRGKGGAATIGPDQGFDR